MTTVTALGQRVTSIHPHREAPTYVYRLYDLRDRLLYVGCTYNPPLRLHQHSTSKAWWPDVARVRLTVFPNREYALAREREAILAEYPAHNKVRLIDTLRRLAAEREAAS